MKLTYQNKLYTLNDENCINCHLISYKDVFYLNICIPGIDPEPTTNKKSDDNPFWTLVDCSWEYGDCFFVFMHTCTPDNKRELFKKYANDEGLLKIDALQLISHIIQNHLFDCSGSSNLNLNILMRCHSLMSFFSPKEDSMAPFYSNLKEFDSKKVIAEIYLPRSFKFPNVSLNQDIQETLNQGNGSEISLKTFTGRCYIDSSEILIIYNPAHSTSGLADDNIFYISITKAPACFIMKYTSKNDKQVFEIPILDYNISICPN